MLDTSTARARSIAQHVRLAAIIAISTLPLLALAAANLARQVQEGETRVTQDRIALARAAALTVSGFVDTSFATLQTLAATPTVADPTPRPELDGLLHQARQTNSPLETIGLFRRDGWNVAFDGLDQPPLTLNVLDREYVQRARLTDTRVVSPATIPRTTGVLTVDLVIPVDFVSGGRGVVSGSLALTKLGDHLRALPGSDLVQIVLVDTSGQVILHPNPDVVRSLTSLRGRADVDAVLVGQTGSMQIPVDGADSLVAYAPVPGYSWGVLVSQPVDAAFSQVRRDLSLALAILAVILTLVVAMGWFFSTRLSSAYRQLLAAKLRAEAAQGQAESAQSRMAFLAQASHVLGSSLEDATTLEQVARLAVPILGDRCTIELNLEPVRVTGVVCHPGDEKHHAEGVLEVPLLAVGRSIGKITCVRTSRAHFTVAEVELTEELAQRVVLAVENARLYQLAQQAVTDRDDFLSVAAHELKTPITSVRGYAQLAMLRLGSAELVSALDLRKPLDAIVTQSERLGRLVEQLLDISRLEAGKLTLTPESIDLVPVLQALIDRKQLMADRHKISYQGPEHAVVTVDLLRLEQVVTNLLDNAVKFSPVGGEVRVELELKEKELRLSVQDEGIGIPADKRGRIFERFFQAHEGKFRTGFAGMGLGLNVSQQIIELHGGSIVVEGPPQGGTRMVVALPISPVQSTNMPIDAGVART
jgi:signal transduction histidine kinase